MFRPSLNERIQHTILSVEYIVTILTVVCCLDLARITMVMACSEPSANARMTVIQHVKSVVLIAEHTEESSLVFSALDPS